MRIAFGGFHIECSTYNPFLTRFLLVPVTT